MAISFVCRGIYAVKIRTRSGLFFANVHAASIAEAGNAVRGHLAIMWG